MNRPAHVVISVAIGAAMLIGLALSVSLLILAGHSDVTFDDTSVRMGPLVVGGDPSDVLARQAGLHVPLVTGLVTLALILVFIAICVWAWSKRRKSDFEAAARLPLDDE